MRHVYREGCIKIPECDHSAFAAALVELLSNESRRKATMPTEDERNAICRRWDWTARCKEFRDFVLRIHHLTFCDDHFR
jgi:glycosyltransferase involved in cell wall biosynthesis